MKDIFDIQDLQELPVGDKFENFVAPKPYRFCVLLSVSFAGEKEREREFILK